MYDRFAAVSRATRDAAAAAEIRFVDKTYAIRRASTFALRNADRVTSLGAYFAPNFPSIQMYSQLQDLVLNLGSLSSLEKANVALLPCSLTKLVITLRTWSINWENFRPLCCLQELKVYNRKDWSGSKVQLDDSFATALPLLKVFHMEAGTFDPPELVRVIDRPYMPLATTAIVVMPHLVELLIMQANMVHLDLHFMSALKSICLINCTVSTVSAACSTMMLDSWWIKKFKMGTVLVTPNLRSLTIYNGGLHKLDGSKCRHALSILYRHSSIEWVGAKPNLEKYSSIEYDPDGARPILKSARSLCNISGKSIAGTVAGMVAPLWDLLLLLMYALNMPYIQQMFSTPCLKAKLPKIVPVWAKCEKLSPIT